MSRPLLLLLAAAGLLAGCETSERTIYESPRYGVYDSGPGWYGRRYDRDRHPGYWGNRNADRYYRNQARQGGRLARPDDDVVCDRRTQVCYKDGKIDKSETHDFFGNKAARRADQVRDKYEEDAFVLRKDVVCDRDRRVCYKDGDPNGKVTRDFFGNKAAKRVDNN